MNKLKNKVFWTLFAILTLFLISILFIFNFQDYQREKVNIENYLTRVNDTFDKDKKMRIISDDLNLNIDNQKVNELEQKIFIDLEVYTVLLDDDKIIDIISHNENEIDEDIIISIAQDIIDNRKGENIKIGNLYITDYSYSFRENNFLTIINNKMVRDRLISSLITSIIIFIILEIIIIFVTIKLTNWIIKPVCESFYKQKQFVTDASHELKTPLSVIMASAEALEEDINERKWLNNIKSEAERMSKLISSLLDLAKLENGSNVEQYTLNNLSLIVEKAVLSFESLIYENDILLNYNIDDDLYIICDGNGIKQLIAILLDNAIKHSSKGGKIIVNLKKCKNDVILEVINEGDPIPKGEEEKIFERFYRIDKSRNRNDNRYGLGLAIAKIIVLNHKGKIMAMSSDGFTTFKVIFKTDLKI